MKKILIIIALLFLPTIAVAQQAQASFWLLTGGGSKYLTPVGSLWGLKVPGLATSTTGCLSVSSTGWISPSGVACGAGGGGSGGGTWSTTTSTVSGKLINYPNNTTDIVVIGSNASTSANYYVDPNINDAFFKNLRITLSTTTSATSTNLYVSNILSLASALSVGNGGTGAATFPQGWIYSNGGTGALAASTSPTVNYITATSTSATSTFGYGISIKAGCFDFNGTCLNTVISNASEYKQAVLYSSTTTLPSNNYVAGVITAVANGALYIDGNNPSAGDRVLIKNEATAANNGIYTVTTVGSGIAAFVLTRATDFDSSSEVYSGVCTHVISGSNDTYSNKNSNWCLDNVGAVTIGTTGLTFSEAGAGASITALTGDITATGPGSAAATLATVNGNVGSFGGVNSIPSFTVNGKGLITAAAANVPAIPASEITAGTFGSGNYGISGILTLSGTGVANAASFQNFTFVNATGTNATSTGSHFALLNFGDLGQFRTITATGTGVSNQSSFQNFTFINATGTSATTTGSFFGTIEAANTGRFTVVNATGTGVANQSVFQNLTFVNATGTQSTSTLSSFALNTFGSLGQFGILNATSTGVAGQSTFQNATFVNGTSTVSWAIPSGAAMTPGSSGQLALDTTSDQLVMFGASAKKVYGNGYIYRNFTYATSTAWTGTTTRRIGIAFVGETIDAAMCFSDVGTVNVQIGTGAASTTMFSASSTVGTMVFTSNTTWASTNRYYLSMGGPASSPVELTCVVRSALTSD